MTIFYCLRFVTPQPGGPCLRIYIPQEQCGPVTPPATGFPCRRLLRPAGLRWRYLKQPPRGDRTDCQSQLQSYVTTDSQSASLSWRQTASGALDQISVSVRQL
jgi:hypothetical protein